MLWRGTAVPGSLRLGEVGGNDGGVFEWTETNDSASTSFSVGTTTYDLAPPATVHMRCVEAPLDLAFDCAVTMHLAFHRDAQASPDCTADFSKTVRFRRENR